ncbi:MAG: hypothetical protein GY790_24515 [Bacteroidetes bacterium]|nr:hypothetical protein [Bacteroidota bacterium]
MEFLYDGIGNIIQKKLGNVAVNYVYNAANRLIRVEDELTGTMIAEYSYDPFGRRLWKEVNGVKTYFFYSDEGLVAEFDINGSEIRNYGCKPDSTWTTEFYPETKLHTNRNALSSWPTPSNGGNDTTYQCFTIT